MAEQSRTDFQLTQQNADKIVSMLDFDDDTFQPKGTPSEVCWELQIDRRTFNSVVSKAIFTKNPTEAQKLLREHIMDIIYNQVHVKG